jgi:hypothetical protein
MNKKNMNDQIYSWGGIKKVSRLLVTCFRCLDISNAL